MLERERRREAEIKILGVLASIYNEVEDAGLRFNQLLMKTSISRPSLAENLKRLLADGLISRRDGSRRIDTRYYITSKGLEYLERECNKEVVEVEHAVASKSLHHSFYQLARKRSLHFALRSRLQTFAYGLLLGVPGLALSKDEEDLLHATASIIVNSVDLREIPQPMHYDAVKAVWVLADNFSAYRFDFLQAFNNCNIPPSVVNKLIEIHGESIREIIKVRASEKQLLKLIFFDFGKYLVLPLNIYKQTRSDLLRKLAFSFKRN
ncbi:MAG: hypothetical protein QXQ02_02160 [Halobacteria archaeon]